MPVYLQGLLLGFAIILPIGPQNAFVMMQGIRRQYYLMSAAVCAVSDIVLLAVGIFAGSFLLSQSSLLLNIITWAGVAFLLWYGSLAFKTAWQNRNDSVDVSLWQHNSRLKIILMLLAVTWLNPHVYLDTVVIFGSVGSQFIGTEQYLFAAGAMTASVVWFFSLSLLAASFAQFLQKPVTQMVIYAFIGIVMWAIAFQLALGQLK